MRTVIFSKNRGCQLELALRSLTITVLYTCDPQFEEGYELVRSMYPSVDFVREGNFKDQLLSLLEDYPMWLCDDDVEIQHPTLDCKEFKEFQSNDSIVCLSMRMCAAHNRPGNRSGPMYANMWDWTKCQHSWGYPMSVSAHVYRKEDIKPIMEREDFFDPSSLEIILRRNTPDKPLMICLDRPNIINNLANQVQTRYRFRNLHIPLTYLEEKFLTGYRISLAHIQKAAIGHNSSFLMIPYEWEDFCAT